MVNYELSCLQSILQNKLQCELTAFWVKAENMIQVLVLPLPAKRQNIGTFDNKGIEFSVKYIILNNLVLHANYNYLFLTKVLLEAPRQQVNFSAQYQYKTWNFNFSAQYIDKLYTQLPTNTADAFTQSYALVNARISYRPLNKVEFFVAGNNLFNQKYEINFAYPMPGMNVSTGFNIRL
jgi:iron complex outermembrane receptor protein